MFILHLQLVVSCFFTSGHNPLSKCGFGHSLSDDLGVVTSHIFALSENAFTSHSLLNDSLTSVRLLGCLVVFLLHLNKSHNNVLQTVKVSRKNYWGLPSTKSARMPMVQK